MAFPSMLSCKTQSERRHVLTIIQQPTKGRAFYEDIKDRIPLDPPLILQAGLFDEHGNESVCEPEDLAFLVAHVSLWSEDGAEARDVLVSCQDPQDVSRMLLGNTVSSVMSSSSKAQNYFIFEDLSIKEPGEYRLAVSLTDIRRNILFGESDTTTIATILTEAFQVQTKVDYENSIDSHVSSSRDFVQQE
ncbi:hypothetical protein K7432_014585 [Basidiobolus ranarum]|uniref:Velvet domain-containing protein n=1 Tax=Basidiobolus ranarum TaxID=34480 RepID=A0ABR2VPC2_9FUNG